MNATSGDPDLLWEYDWQGEEVPRAVPVRWKVSRYRCPGAVSAMMKTWRIGLGLLCGIVSTAQGAVPALVPGDCWSYSGRPGEGQSYVVIRKIETYPSQGTVVHISVFGLKLKVGEVVIEQLPHLALGADSLRATLREKVTRTPLDADWLKHYQIWYQRYGSKGRPAVTHAPLREVLRDLEKLNGPRG